jgi:hypothetical protein
LAILKREALNPVGRNEDAALIDLLLCQELGKLAGHGYFLQDLGRKRSHALTRSLAESKVFCGYGVG